MNKSKHPHKALLIEQIERKYGAFKENMVQLGGEALYELAPTIAAVHDAYTYIKSAEHLTEGYAAHLIKHGNPLHFLADKWKQELTEFGDEDFDDMLFQLMSDSDYEELEDDAVAALVDEILGKYGDDMSLDTATNLEVIALTKELFKRLDKEDGI